MDCSICYLQSDNLISLNCHHELCKDCINRLQKFSCPFCRCDITDQIRNLQERKINKEYSYSPPLIRINVRRRRRRRRRSNSEEQINELHESSSIQIVSGHDRKGKKKSKKKRAPHIDRKKQKYKHSRKNRWNELNRQRNF